MQCRSGSGGPRLDVSHRWWRAGKQDSGGGQVTRALESKWGRKWERVAGNRLRRQRRQAGDSPTPSPQTGLPSGRRQSSPTPRTASPSLHRAHNRKKTTLRPSPQLPTPLSLRQPPPQLTSAAQQGRRQLRVLHLRQPVAERKKGRPASASHLRVTATVRAGGGGWSQPTAAWAAPSQRRSPAGGRGGAGGGKEVPAGQTRRRRRVGSRATPSATDTR